jgi:hypothetical protein
VTHGRDRKKANRRANRLLDEAWVALQGGNPQLAAKIARRALEVAPGNPRIEEDYHALLAELGGPATRIDMPAAPPAREAGHTPEPEPRAPATSFLWLAHAPWWRGGGTVLERELREAIEIDAATIEFTVQLDDPRRGRYRMDYLKLPLAEPIARLRGTLYERTTGEPHAELLARCRAAGQRFASCARLQLPAGGFTPLQREAHKTVAAPFQAHAILVGRPRLQLVDLRPGRKLHEHEFRAGPGDVVLVCGRERPVEVGGVVGLQPTCLRIDAGDAPATLLTLRFEDD